MCTIEFIIIVGIGLLIVWCIAQCNKDPTEGLCDDCGLIETTNICGYGSHSGLPFFRCADCVVIHKAEQTKLNRRLQKRKTDKLKNAKKYLRGTK